MVKFSSSNSAGRISLQAPSRHSGDPCPELLFSLTESNTSGVLISQQHVFGAKPRGLPLASLTTLGQQLQLCQQTLQPISRQQQSSIDDSSKRCGWINIALLLQPARPQQQAAVADSDTSNLQQTIQQPAVGKHQHKLRRKKHACDNHRHPKQQQQQQCSCLSEAESSPEPQQSSHQQHCKPHQDKSGQPAAPWWACAAQAKLLVAGAASAIVSRTAMAPLERVKMDLLLKTSGRSAVDTARWVWQREGLAGFWKGNGINLLRTAPFKVSRV